LEKQSLEDSIGHNESSLKVQIVTLTGQYTVHKLGPWYAIGTLQIIATKVGFVVFGMSMNTEAR
jgi:hypothetical protein